MSNSDRIAYRIAYRICYRKCLLSTPEIDDIFTFLHNITSREIKILQIASAGAKLWAQSPGISFYSIRE